MQSMHIVDMETINKTKFFIGGKWYWKNAQSLWRGLSCLSVCSSNVRCLIHLPVWWYTKA